MTTKKFITRTTIKIIAFAIFTTIVFGLANSPVIANNIALGQMENSDVLYMMMETYNQTKHFVSIIYNCITVFFAGTIIYDIFKFIQTKTKEKN